MPELREKIKELSSAFSEFKEGNQERIDELEKRLNRPKYSDGNGSNEKGGKSLDGDGSVKVYKPEQKLAADAPVNDEFKDVDLGGFLRGVVGEHRNEAEKQLAQKSVSSGDYNLPVNIASEFVDLLRAANPLTMAGGAGARTLSLEGGETKYIKITNDPTASWKAELAEASDTDPGFDAVSLSPKTVIAVTEVGNELLQDSENISEALTSAFVGSINNAILNATFGGATSNGPTGLATTVTQTEEYSNGGSPDWSNFVNASKTLYDNNVPEGNRSFLYAPDVWQTLALTTDDNNRYQEPPSFIRDIPRFTSSGVSAGEGYVGDFSNVVYGFRRNITVRRFPGASARKYGTLWVTAARLDIAVFRPKALVRIEEASA